MHIAMYSSCRVIKNQNGIMKTNTWQKNKKHSRGNTSLDDFPSQIRGLLKAKKTYAIQFHRTTDAWCEIIQRIRNKDLHFYTRLQVHRLKNFWWFVSLINLVNNCLQPFSSTAILWPKKAISFVWFYFQNIWHCCHFFIITRSGQPRLQWVVVIWSKHS